MSEQLTTGPYAIYLQHIDRMFKVRDYASWYCAFFSTILAHPWQEWPHGHLEPYAFPMQLFDAHYPPQEAVELFVRADMERYARQMEVGA